MLFQGTEKSSDRFINLLEIYSARGFFSITNEKGFRQLINSPVRTIFLHLSVCYHYPYTQADPVKHTSNPLRYQ